MEAKALARARGERRMENTISTWIDEDGRGSGLPALAAIVTDRTAAADNLLRTSELIATLAESVAAILRDSIEHGAPFTAVMLDTTADPEARGWTELVFSVSVRADFAETMRWWKSISARRAELNQFLPEHERAVLARSIGIHLSPID